jgi:hypothetical protein
MHILKLIFNKLYLLYENKTSNLLSIYQLSLKIKVYKSLKKNYILKIYKTHQ